jgi:transcriptional regulator with XRE-family HTH domain
MRSNAKLPRVIGKRIQKRRKEVGLTQEELAEKAGISRAYMGYIEQGRNAPSLEILEKIANLLKLPLKELF